jgi:mannitol/fructose-specific phosphotransferase system IIA component (Ntr-type)
MPADGAIQTRAPVCLADYTSVDLIIPELQRDDVAGVVQELCQVLRKADRVADLLPFYQATLVREYMVSTVVGPGIAFPHARLHGLPQACFALGRSQQPVIWGSGEPSPVRLIFLSAVPATDAADYLCMLSGLTRLTQQQTLVEELLRARHPEEMLAVLKQVRLRESTLVPG